MSQVFKHTFPIDIFYDLLTLVCDKKYDHYAFNMNSFKKMILFDLLDGFLANCKEYYHISKHKYIDRKMTYNNFVTILRQIAKLNQVDYKSNIKYSKSSYNIEYCFYTKE